MKSPIFIALDFETADYYRDSACALGIVKVRGMRIVHEESCYIRPPRRRFRFSYLHGITWEDVAESPRFRQVWLSLRHLFEDVDFIAAHNAPFDRSVLYTCCDDARIRPPDVNFFCTQHIARQIWGIYPTTLPNVCHELRISLNHHDPLSDAKACARIVMKAIREGWFP